MSRLDAFCAVATPPGEGGIAVVRVSGADALAAAEAVWQGRKLSDCPTHTVHLGHIVDRSGDGRPTIVDQAVATIFRGPASYTGLDTVELSVHGSVFVQQEVVRLLVKAGARLAEPGEFTRQAFLAGHLDLAQAEAVADLIGSRSRAEAQAATRQLAGGISARIESLRERLVELASLLELELDFSEEDVEFASRAELTDNAKRLHTEITSLLSTYEGGSALHEGVNVVLAGAPNAGKSTLFNALAGDDRAIVSDQPGTTRDTLDATIGLGDHRVRLTDTAGLRRDTAERIEAIGVERAVAQLAKAHIVLRLWAPALPCPDEMLPPEAASAIVIDVATKADLGLPFDAATPAGSLAVSAATGEGLDLLRQKIADACCSITGHTLRPDILTNARHAAALSEAAEALARVADALAQSSAVTPTITIAHDLRAALDSLACVTGVIATPHLLHSIFSRFCIGK